MRDKDDLQRIVTVHSRATQKLEGQKGLLEVRIKELEREAEKYRTFKEREPQLLHYLSVISPMSK